MEAQELLDNVLKFFSFDNSRDSGGESEKSNAGNTGVKDNNPRQDTTGLGDGAAYANNTNGGAANANNTNGFGGGDVNIGFGGGTQQFESRVCRRPRGLWGATAAPQPSHKDIWANAHPPKFCNGGFGVSQDQVPSLPAAVEDATLVQIKVYLKKAQLERRAARAAVARLAMAMPAKTAEIGMHVVL